MPVKISLSDDGRTIFITLVRVDSRSTRETLIRSLSMDATPTAVLISVGHSEHSVTVIAEIRKDFCEHRVGADVERADHQRDDRQPGERRHRPEDLDQRIERRLHRLGSDRTRCRAAPRPAWPIMKPANTVYRLVKIWST